MNVLAQLKKGGIVCQISVSVTDFPQRWTPKALLEYAGEDDSTERQLKSKLYEASRRREFVGSWLVEFPWLKYDEVERKMYCKVCLQHPEHADKRSSFILGNTSFRKHNLQHHEMSIKHKQNLVATITSLDVSATNSADQIGKN